MLHSGWFTRISSAVLLAGLVMAVPGASVAHAQGPSSTAAATELAALLDAAKLDAIAAVDPADPSTWVAALYFKDGQLLVVSAQYAAPELLIQKLQVRDYLDIYLALFSSSVPGTRVFATDSNANGLAARPSNGAAPDTWERADVTMTFDGEWRRAKISEADYRKAFDEADEHYTRLLKLLSAQARGPGGT
ncbi:MAG: hypothetical protein H0T05_03705 [Acidobacteria bacterium]|nr:hypothetical protein [Acidobacteriota bacterium]MBA3885352.1 hypothetical protein [Acidobacteriota bacterium]